MSALTSISPSDLSTLLSSFSSGMSPIRVKQVSALRRLSPVPRLFIPEISSAFATPVLPPLKSDFDTAAPTIVVSSESCSQTRVIAPNTSLSDTNSVNTIICNSYLPRPSPLSFHTSYESPANEEDPFGVTADSWYCDDLPTPTATPVYTTSSAASSSATLVDSPGRTSTLLLKTSYDTPNTPSRASITSIHKSLKRRNAVFSKLTSTSKASGTRQHGENSLPPLPPSSLQNYCEDICAVATTSEHHNPSIASSRTIPLEAVKRTHLALLPVSTPLAPTTHTSTMRCIAGGCTPDSCSHMTPLRLVDVSAYRSAAPKKSLMKRSALRVMKLRVR
jgi:hypothetical protein